MSSETGDFPILKVTGNSLARLKSVMNLTTIEESVGYIIDQENRRIVFFQYDDELMTAFPTSLSMERCAELAFDWLQNVSYPEEPDHDGDNSKGWFCETEEWGHINPYGYKAFVCVKPHWIMYGK